MLTDAAICVAAAAAGVDTEEADQAIAARVDHRRAAGGCVGAVSIEATPAVDAARCFVAEHAGRLADRIAAPAVG
jgi:hypothetical protein